MKRILLVIILCLLSRMPQLLSSNLLLDGDECIVGLMAKHMLEGKEVPIYFYGQSYGFSFIEVVCIDLFYLLFGVNDIAIKLAMLFLWTIGVLLFYLTLRQLHSSESWTPLLITVVLIFAPAWAVWSMKARGGYMTSFVLCSLLTFLLFNNKFNRRLWIYLIAGSILGVIYESQPLWLPGLLPILIYHFYRQRKVRQILIFIVGLIASLTLFYLLKQNSSEFWSPGVFSFSGDLSARLIAMPERIFMHMSGSYYYGQLIELNSLNNFLAVCYTAAILLVPAIGIYLLIAKKPLSGKFYAFCCSVIMTCGMLLLIEDYSPRYLLPLTVFALLMFSEIMGRTYMSRSYKFLFVIFIAIGGICLFTFRDYRFQQAGKKELLLLANKLDTQNIRHIFCFNGLLQWQIMFYSKENIKARYIYNTDRYPAYVKEVNQAFYSGAHTAIVGFAPPPEKLPAPAGQISLIESSLFIYPDPGRTVLEEYGFDLGNKE